MGKTYFALSVGPDAQRAEVLVGRLVKVEAVHGVSVAGALRGHVQGGPARQR